ncbi:SWF or SNF family helicase [Streptomyces sp. NPDC003522]
MKSHDSGRERTFQALPPARGGGFARSWWGRAWLAALEEGALDGEQVRTGRKLARAGAVGSVSVRPGRVTAVVKDRDGTGHRADVLLDVLTDGQWDRFLDLAAERAGHVAALLDRELPPHLVEDAGTAGVDLLPGPGDLEAECGCGAWDHCRHTTALCHQVARLLDEDPFVLLLLRGGAEQALLADLQARGTATAPTGTAPAPREGVDALEAYLAGHVLPPLPAVPELPVRPGVPPSSDTEAPPPGEVEPAALELLAARTAVRARALLAEALRGGPDGTERRAPAEGLTVGEDAVRLAADGPRDAAVPCPVWDRLAAGSGRGGDRLEAAVRAWRIGGRAALAVLEEEWTVEGEALARARAALDAAWTQDERPALRARGNRWTVVGSAGQLRLGRDGRWWPYRKERGRWVPAGDACGDPATALASMRSDGEERPS